MSEPGSHTPLAGNRPSDRSVRRTFVAPIVTDIEAALDAVAHDTFIDGQCGLPRSRSSWRPARAGGADTRRLRPDRARVRRMA